MFATAKNGRLTDTLDRIAKEIDITEAQYARIYDVYHRVNNHLCEPSSSLAKYDPGAYIQGSVRIGTTNRPVLEGEEVDADSVILLQMRKEDITQAALFAMVGGRLKQHPEFARVLRPGRRCWTLDYPDEFHMDILPALPDLEAALPGRAEGILITDKKLHRWLHSNPIGYANWFKERMGQQLIAELEALALREGVSVEQIPIYRVKTTLQKVVQLLKRHRDIYFQENPNNRPISIAITTLAARAYAGQDDLAEAFVAIALALRDHIECDGDRYTVSNPVQPEENFLDKWEQYPERQKAFFRWLDKLEKDVIEIQKGKSLITLSADLKGMFGKNAVENAVAGFGDDVRVQRDTGRLKVAASTGALGNTGVAQVRPHTFHSGKCSD